MKGDTAFIFRGQLFMVDYEFDEAYGYYATAVRTTHPHFEDWDKYLREDDEFNSALHEFIVKNNEQKS